MEQSDIPASARATADQIFETQSKDEMQRYGQILRHVREALGLKLEDIAKEQKISITYLMAIERMEMGPIPQGYLTGYLRIYANVLGLPQARVVQEYTAACGATQTVFEPKPVPKIGELDHTPDRRALIIASGGAAVAIALLIAVFVVKPDGSANKATPASTIVVEQAGNNSLFFDATRRLPNHAVQLPLELVAVKQAWIEVRAADGTIFRSRVMARGETYYPRLDAGWTVSVKDGAAFEWRVGDIVVGPLGEEEGVPVFSQSVDQVLALAADLSAPDLAANEAGVAQP